jgi:hypothetical protein
MRTRSQQVREGSYLLGLTPTEGASHRVKRTVRAERRTNEPAFLIEINSPAVRCS